MFAGITTNNALPPHYHCPKCHHHEWTGNLKKDYTINDEIVTKTLKIGLDFDDKHCPSCGELMWSDGFSGDFRSFVGAELDKIPDWRNLPQSSIVGTQWSITYSHCWEVVKP